MKYPQLVSPRAVNAISDWLVSRLEQLGVESPQIYTRLLLSLLQSSVQVNDPIEFSNLEAFFASRKGGHKRFHLPSDTETLKKLNAVQCLREIVSNEQETATIEQLVDELREKLKDIEKQTQNLNDEHQFLIETHFKNDSTLQEQINLQLQQQQQQQQANSSTTTNNNNNNQHNSRHHQQQLPTTSSSSSSLSSSSLSSSLICNNSHHTKALLLPHHHHHHNNNSSSSVVDSKHNHNVLATTTTSTAITTNADAVNDIDNDPKKRYFRAFPALSKEMEDSFRIWRRNAKSLTWPIVGRTIQVVENCNNSTNNHNNNSNTASLSSSSASSVISSSNIGGVGSVGGAGTSLSTLTNKNFEKKLINKVYATESACDGDHIQQQHQNQVAAIGASATKKKSKRRRQQALCKGKNIQNVRKLSAVNASNSIGGGNKYHQYSHHRNTSSPAWDTDFKGCWEMGPDLIKEFLNRQKGNKRNRSNSDSMEQEEQRIHDTQQQQQLSNEIPPLIEHNTPEMKRYIDLSFCCEDDDKILQREFIEVDCGVDYVDEDYDDNALTSISELAMDNINPKRLYQRESHLQNVAVVGDATDSVDSIDFQQFKAKFNSNVEALWKDAEQTPASSMTQTVPENLLSNNNNVSAGISTSFYATTSLNALAPFKKDLWNFWSNYNQQQHHYDRQQLANKLAAATTTSSMIAALLADSGVSSGTGNDSSDYFSMPSNWDDFDKNMMGGGLRRGNETANAASLDAHTPSINVFLQNSIWSTSRDCMDGIGGGGGGGTSSTIADTDESFLIKVWNSNKKLSQLDVGHGGNGEKLPTLATDAVEHEHFITKSKESSSIINNPSLGANLQFPPYQSLKWSEGINAGPPSCNNNLLCHANVSNTTNLRDGNTYASLGAATVNISGATWEAPAYGQNAQPDLKSWCASNPMSLTEMYGSDVCDSIVNQSSPDDSEQNNPADMAAVGEPSVTLPNHSVNSSGFVAYAHIKQCGIVKPSSKPLQLSNALRLPKDFFRSGEEENLLNSERTHFRPIENFVDGHTFEINDSLDTVEFERTASGFLFHESEEYLEYTRNDIYMADEEVSTSSTNLLKYNNLANEDTSDMFVIKFRVRRSEEVACQTEEHDFQLAATKMAELSNTTTNTLYLPQMESSNMMFNNTFSLSRQANNEAIMAAVTKAVAAAAKAAAENHLKAGHFTWLHSTHNSSAAGTSSNNSTVETNTNWLASDASVCDEVDFYRENSINSSHPNYVLCCETSEAGGQQQQQQLSQYWSMQEVEKQCHQRRCLPTHLQQPQQHEYKTKYTTSVDIETTEENSLDNTPLHTLWGMCAACNSCEYGKSMPANRLLRDELQLEADEIMSDLRYMQDLYIGESSDMLNAEENENNAVDKAEVEMNDTLMTTSSHGNKEKKESKFMKNPWNIDNDTMQVSMLQRVNQLIEDLLKSDNTVKTASQETEQFEKNIFKATELKNVWDMESKMVTSKNLWQYNEKENDKNIWQQKPIIAAEQYEGKATAKSKIETETLIKPMKLLKQVGGSFTEDPLYMDTLNWEHENLAKIWQEATSTPTATVAQAKKTLPEQPQQMRPEDFKEKCQQKDLPKPKELKKDEEKEEDMFLKGNQKLVEEKNLRNLQTTNTTAVTSSDNFKRVQHFLNNTAAAKLKLVANRKRRHSASQNFYQQQQQQHLQYSGNNNNNNNNNDTITDLNVYRQKLNPKQEQQQQQQQPPQQQQQKKEELLQREAMTHSNMTTPKTHNLDDQPTEQTIITCKYWATATTDSATAAMMLLAAATNVNTKTDNNIYEPPDDIMLEENYFSNTFSCLIDKNASILKHMSMMTRPLTR